MKVLLDTHAFLWWVNDDARLSSRAREVIADPRNTILFSAASGWEIVIKAKLGRLQVPADLEGFFTEQLRQNSMEALPVHLVHAVHVYRLPNHHRDPFDRLLIAQSRVENAPLITAERLISAYSIETVW